MTPDGEPSAAPPETADDGAEPGDGPSLTPMALLFGAAACVSCLTTIAFGAAALLGVSIVPPALLGTSDATLALSGVLFAAFGVVGYRGVRRAERARRRGERPDPYWTVEPRQAAASVVLGTVAVAVLAMAAKLAVETATELSYTIHWFETVPLLALGMAWVINGEWNQRRRERDG